MAKKKHRRPRVREMQQEVSYVCDACGEEIVIPVDPSQGDEQSFVEDCPVCCRPNVVQINIESDGTVRAWAEGE
ncbi:CPXCG motif-containing cysteine-rich protein [Anatilimnocola floriformis]|uniref:CPXCG motif-containing cysteine-rich protein n=1 Tax=Anatilimnocola floriformis TaxID=2948575 RepID=UPI0020C4CC02|nr:CPXCG motif-containing cysteine-rich protein [Anatilimnocola floriformis]